MDISTRAEYAADPDQVFAMLTDRGFLEEVCQASEAKSYEVTVEGTTTRTRRTLAAPEAAARFTGPDLTVVEEVVWQPGGTGPRTGEVQMSVPGQPVTMRGQLRLLPNGAGTAVELTGDLKVAIPLLGRKLEQAAAPAVLAGFQTQQKVGTAWLTR